MLPKRVTGSQNPEQHTVRATELACLLVWIDSLRSTKQTQQNTPNKTDSSMLRRKHKTAEKIKPEGEEKKRWVFIILAYSLFIFCTGSRDHHSAGESSRALIVIQEI